MGIGITLLGGGGGGGTPSVIKVANAAARLALSTSDGLLVLQLDNNILYEYDNVTTSWLILADPAQVGFYRVANAAALAALTPIDGSYAHQLDTDELFQYNLATTTWQLMAAFARRGVYRPADAAALAAITALDGDIAVQLDTNVVYQYDLGTTSWIIVSDPLAPGVRKVADAAALAALTGMTDGDLAIQLDQSWLFEYKVATTDWVRVGGIGVVAAYSGYDQVTGEVTNVPGAFYISSATQFYGTYYNATLAATLTDMQLGATVDTVVDGQTASDLRGFSFRSSIGAATATSITNIAGFTFSANFQANITAGSLNTFADSATFAAGAAVTDISSFNSYQQINQATMNQYKSFQSAATVGSTDPAHMNGFTAFGAFDQFGPQADLDGYNGLNISPSFQTGAVVDGFTAININPQLDVVGLNGYRNIEVGGNFGQNSATSVSNHIDFQAHPAYRPNATLSGSYTGLSLGPSFEEGSSIGGANAIYHNMDVRGTVTGGVAGYASNDNLGAGSAPTTISNYQGFNSNPNLGANLTLGDFSGIIVRPNVQAGANVTGNVTMLDIGINAALPIAGNATGISVNMSNFGTPAMPQGLSVQVGGSQLSANFDTGIYPVQSTGGPYGLNNIGGTLHIAPGFPITGANFGIGNNLGIGIILEDDIPVDSTGLDLGFFMNGFLTQIAAAAGKTMANLTFMGAGASIPTGVVPTDGGTFDTIQMFRALGVLSFGGTAIINNMYGFKVEPTLTAASPVNAWGFWCGDTNAENYLARSLAIGTGTQKVANADVALEIGSVKAFVHGRMTTVQRDALTPIAGMEIYNTDENQLEYYTGTAWEVVGARLVVQPNGALTDGVDFDPPNKRRQVCQVSGNGGPVSQTDIDITDAQEGDELMFIGTDNDNTVTFVSATNTVLNGSCTLAMDDTLSLIFVNGKYREFARNA